jgi:antitoxin MazE
MAQLIKIGNSQGVRIPKALIAQAQLAGKELTIKAVDEGLLLVSTKRVREGWAQEIEQAVAVHGAGLTDSEWLDAPLITEEEGSW